MKDETPVECKVTVAIGDFQKSLPFVSDVLLHTAINFGLASRCKAVPYERYPQYLMKARLGFAWPVAIVINSIYHDASMIPLCSDKRTSL